MPAPASIRARVLAEHPEFCTTRDVARMLGISKRAVSHYRGRIPNVVIDGIRFFNRDAAMKLSATYTGRADRVVVKGLEAQRLRKICEVFAKTQSDRAPHELVALAKKIGNLK